MNKLFKNIKNVKKCERIKFPTLTKYSDSFITTLPIYYNVLDERIDLTGMTGMVIDDEQSNIQIRLDDDKYKEDLNILFMHHQIIFKKERHRHNAPEGIRWD